MSDLVKRLRDCEFMGMPDARLDYSTASEAAARIEALKARIAKADALAEVCNELSQEAYGYEWLYETTFHRDVHESLEKALASYREGSDT
jgi:hypothetical protein